MTGLLLATLVHLSPGTLLLDNVEARNVALCDVRFSPLFASDDERVPRPMFEQLSREQLIAELRRLDETRPGLGGPIALLSVGVALIIPGVGVTIGGIIGLIASKAGVSMGVATGISAVVMGVGVIMVAVGIVLTIVGAISLGARIRTRSINGKQMDEVRRRLDALDNGQPLGGPTPAQANFVIPGPLQTVMTF